MHNCHLLLLVQSEIYDLVMLSQFVRINHIDPDHCCVQPKKGFWVSQCFSNAKSACLDWLCLSIMVLA